MKKLETVGVQEEFEHQDSKFLQHCTKKIVINFNCSHCNGSVFSKEFNNYEKGEVLNIFLSSNVTESLLFSYSKDKPQWPEPWK